MTVATRPTPLAVRLSPQEKTRLKEVARQVGTNRNHLIRTALSEYVGNLRDQGLIE